MPRMQMKLICWIGNEQYEVFCDQDSEVLLASKGVMAVESALVSATDELRRKLAVGVHERRNGAKGERVNPYGLGEK